MGRRPLPPAPGRPGRLGPRYARGGHLPARPRADLVPSMLATARRLDPDVEWILSDIASLDLGRTFAVVVMAGNVPLFTPPGTQAALVAGCARHLDPGGALVAGFQLNGEYGLDDY